MNIVCYHSIDQVRPWAEELEAINRSSRLKSPFSTFAFIENFCRHNNYYPGDRQAELWFLLAMEDGKPRGYVALRRVDDRVFGFKAAKLEFLMTHDVDCPHLVAPPEDELRISAEVYRYLLSRRSEWSFLELLQQRPDSALTPPPQAVDLDRHHVRTFPAKETHLITLKWPTLAQYFAAMAPNFRQNLRTQVKRLVAEGELTTVSSSDPATTPVLFELAQIVAARSWKTSSWVSVLSHPDRLAYFRDLLSPKQPLKPWLCVMMLDGFPIAANIWGSYGNTVYDLIDLYDGALERCSPGTTLRLLNMHWAIGQKFDGVDLLAGYAYYKARWLADETPTHSGQLFRKGSLHWLKAALGDLRRQAHAKTGQVVRLDFNPAKREAGKYEGPARTLDVSQAQRGRAEALMAQLDRLPVDRMSHAQIIQAMPFDARRRRYASSSSRVFNA